VRSDHCYRSTRDLGLLLSTVYCYTRHPGLLSLSLPLYRLEWLPSESWGVNGHIAWYTSPYPWSRSVRWMPGWWLASGDQRQLTGSGSVRVLDTALYKCTVYCTYSTSSIIPPSLKFPVEYYRTLSALSSFSLLWPWRWTFLRKWKLSASYTWHGQPSCQLWTFCSYCSRTRDRQAWDVRQTDRQTDVMHSVMWPSGETAT